MPESLNDVFVISAELEESYKVSMQALKDNDMAVLQQQLLLYQQALYQEILNRFGSENQPIFYKPDESEIHPIALFQFKQEIDAYIAGSTIFIMALVKERPTFFLSEQSFIWTSEIFCMWENGLQNSQVEQCVIGERELERRLQAQREVVEAEEQRLRARSRRHKWLLFTAQAVASAPAFFIPGAALPIMLVRIAVTGATAAALNAGFVAVDNARSGDEISADLGNAALTGLQAGVVNATAGEALRFAAGSISTAWKSAVEQSANAATSTASQSSQVIAETAKSGTNKVISETIKQGGKKMATSSITPRSQALAEAARYARGAYPGSQVISDVVTKSSETVTDVMFQSVHFPYKGVVDVMRKKPAEIEIDLPDQKKLTPMLEIEVEKMQPLSAEQIQDQEQLTLFALLINAEISVYNQYTSMKDSVATSSYQNILTQMQKRLESMLHLFQTSNAKLIDDLDRKLSPLEKRIDEAYYPLSAMSTFATKMADWSEQFYDDPSKCSTNVLKNPFDSSDIEEGKSSYLPASNQKWAVYAEVREVTSLSLEQKILELFDSCKNEEKCLSVLLDTMEKHGLSNLSDTLAEQEETYRANVEQYGPLIQSWLTWQKEMLPHISAMKQNVTPEINSDVEGGHYVSR